MGGLDKVEKSLIVSLWVSIIAMLLLNVREMEQLIGETQ